ncbi:MULTISPECIES: hypothetical protein [Candidatus Ichthyocystis]
MCNFFSIIFIEDVMDEYDWSILQSLIRSLIDRVQLVGDNTL